MNDFIIEFVGIVFFYVTAIGGITNARQVIIPDAQTGKVYGKQQIESHIPYILVDQDHVDHAGWGKEDGKFDAKGFTWKYFVLKGVVLTTNASDTALDTSGHDGRVPHVEDWCPGFALSLKNKPVAATFDITRGVLTASGDISKDEASITRLKLRAQGGLVITATATDGTTKKLTVSKGAFIYLGNQPPPAMQWKDVSTISNHFLIFYSLGADEKCDVKIFPGHGHTAMPIANPNPRASQEPDRNLHADCSNAMFP